MKFQTVLFALLMGVCSVAWAQQKGPAAGKDLYAKDPLADKQAPPQAYDKPLPEMKGVLSWKTLGEVKPVKQKDKFVPEFAKAVSALDKKEVKLQGFMMPLDMGEKQQRFILTALPPSCSFCLPGGPEQMVEVQTKTPVKYGFEPILLTGKLAVLKDDPMGLYYRLTDAVLTVSK
ncbi:MAG: DUF3299 domain-containing protein [Burkholderiales bacterium]